MYKGFNGVYTIFMNWIFWRKKIISETGKDSKLYMRKKSGKSEANKI